MTHDARRPLSDLHVHSTNSFDGRGTVAAMCERAVELGLERIAFTEHVDFEPTDIGYGYYDYERSLRDIAAAREQFGNSLAILNGVEVDYQPAFHQDVVRFLSDKHFDLVIGAAHYVNHQWVERDYLPGRDMAETYPAYFRAIRAVAVSGLFEVLAHFDLCKRLGHVFYGPYDPRDFRGVIREALAAMVERDMALEINTSGLRQPPGEPYPPAQVVQWFRELGGRRICLGSDAHEPSQVGFGFERAVAVAEEAGFTPAANGLLSAL